VKKCNSLGCIIKSSFFQTWQKDPFCFCPYIRRITTNSGVQYKYTCS